MITRLLLLVLSTGIISPQLSAQSPSDATPNRETVKQEVIEEVTVIGMRDIISLRNKLFRAEDQFFELYNEINDEDIYDVVCRMRAPTGTRIARRECLPNFYRMATSEEGQAWVDSFTGHFGVQKPANFVIAHHYPIMEEKMKLLIKENPNLFERSMEVYQLTEQLEENRRVYFDRQDD